MAIASPSTLGFSPAWCCSRVAAYPIFQFPFTVTLSNGDRTSTRRSSIVSHICSSKSIADGGSLSPDGGGGSNPYELQYFLPAAKLSSPGFPVFVKLPVDTVGRGGMIRRKKTLAWSFRALVEAGVEGVVIEVWWGLVEGLQPGAYDWDGYLELMALAKQCGLKVRVVLAFHCCGAGPDDPQWISLPQWVMAEIANDPDIAYADKFGRRNLEYISLGCDTLPVLRGRSPIQVYSDFMRSFRDNFKPFLGVIIIGIQVGMGPTGELRYPSGISSGLEFPVHHDGAGEFQCYDKYMLASLNACAQSRGVPEWENWGPFSCGNMAEGNQYVDFLATDNGPWNTTYGKFFLEWYSEMLLLHGERICREAETIFRSSEVYISGKVAALHGHYCTDSHSSELTAGYYNTSIRDGYLPIARMFARYGFSLCYSGFEMIDVDERQINPLSSPEGLLRQILLAARFCEVAMEGENTDPSLDDKSMQQVLKMSRFYYDGLRNPTFSFNFSRMNKNMFEFSNWVRFTQFVKQMSEVNIFRAKLDFGGAISRSIPSKAAKSGADFAYC